MSDYKLVKQVLSNSASAGRPQNPVVCFFGEDRGLVNSEGPTWNEQRPFTVRKLREMGLFKSSIENIILEEVKATLKVFQRYADKDKLISDKEMMFNGAVVNALWALVAGERHDWDGPVQPKILTVSQDLLKNVNRMGMTGLFFAPGLRHIAPKLTGWTALVNSVADFKKIMDDTVNKHTKNHDSNNLQ